ncbi:MAG TPA: aspartyl protease family protein [Candidatus Angelobacter sp.]|jgi:hypothetical protein
MNRKTATLFFSLFVLAQLAILTGRGFAQALQPSQSEVLDRWTAALGGRKKLAAVESIHLNAKLESGGMKGTFDRWVASKGQLHETVDIPGAYHQESVLQGKQAWVLDPSGKVHELSDGDLEDLIAEAYEATFSFLLQDRMQGKVEFTGEDATHKFYLVKLSPAGGKPLTVFLDKETYLPDHEETQQASFTVTTAFSGWHNQSGLQVPGTFRQSNGDPRSDSTFTVESFDINPAQTASLFERPRETAAAVKYLAAGRSVRIPVEISGNVLYMKVRINGSDPGWFILDTGSVASVIASAWAKKLKLETNGDFGTTGSGGAAAVSLIKDVVFGLPGVEVPASTVLVLDLSELLPFFGRDVVGILGYDVISRFVTRIDYEHKMIELSDPNTFKYSGKGTEIPMAFHGNTPQVRVSILLPGRAPIETTADIDTGANGVQLTKQFIDSHDVVAAIGKAIVQPAFGVGGGSDALLGRLGGIQIGPYIMHGPLALLMRGDKGGLADPSYGVNMGAEILSRFITTFDYSNKRIFLEPVREFAAPFPLNGSGLLILSEGADFKTLRVDRMQPDSPAAAAGVQAGDIITEIDGRPATGFTRDEINRMFEQDGRPCRLRLKRGAHTFKVTFRIRVPL